ncbi:unnamed protein product [Pseudo-nitzschia multistriata]|uniref:Metallo-beta-lactamase domain-containing protein n=1 Tax=Pseudo-nitzschia multistriata TaxID=183589 RepID=A0A448Z757_9STRA|nr:unnamed protein product [Pseudo-nitzschia multistriata]
MMTFSTKQISLLHWLLLLIIPSSEGFISPPPLNSNSCQNQRVARHAFRQNYDKTIVKDQDAWASRISTRPSTDASTSQPLFGRRRAVKGMAGAIASNFILPTLPALASPPSYAVPTPVDSAFTSWPLGKVAFSLLPLAGTSTRRATVQTTIIEDSMWTHDQIQGVVNVNVPVRQTVIRLKDGGLWVHNPVAPTPQVIEMMKELEKKYGPVKHIVLGTVALEHKATFGPFCQKFPKATVWIQPGQWAFPVDIPIDALGVKQKGQRLRELPVPGKPATNSIFRTNSKYGPPEWQDEIDFEVLGPITFQSVGAYSETAFYHKASKSLLVTDVVVGVDKNPPAIIQEDPRALLFHARDNITEVVADTPENRERGWRRMVQFGLVFFPSQITVVPAGEALKEASQVDRSMKNLGDGAVPINLYPWTWDGNSDEKNFQVISNNGKLFCPPILTKLILDREPQLTLDWVDRVCRRFPDMNRIIPCHLNNDIKMTAKDFSDAFDPLRSTPQNLKSQRPLAEDLALLQKASDLLTTLKVVGPSQVCDGESARIVGRFASLR